MDIYDSRYFVINKTLLCIAGLWPYDSYTTKLWKRILLSSSMIIMGLPSIVGIYIRYGKDVDRFLEHVGVLLYTLLILMRICTTTWFENKHKILYDTIRTNWELIVDKQEQDKLIEYSEKGRLITIAYLAYSLVAVVIFLTLPLIPISMDKIWPLSERRTRIFILNGEYLVDQIENYGKIYLFEVITSIISCLVFLPVDTIYATSIEHCLGLFAIVQYRLRKPGKLITNKNFSNLQQNNDSYRWIVEIIKLHNIILNFAYTLESTYSASYLVAMGLNLLFFSILSVLIQVNFGNGNVLNTIRYILLTLGHLIHLFYISWPGQKLINHSSDLYHDAYFNEWYEGSDETKKMLKFITLRCSVPCRLTAGGLYTMNFENFLSIMKTSVSYITVFSSIR